MKSNLKLTAVISSMIGFLFLAGCDPTAKKAVDFYPNVESVDLTAEKINSISINSTENEVITAFGKPNNVEEVENPKSKYLSYDGVEFALIDDKVIRLLLTRESEHSKKYETVKEIENGDLKEKVINEYGPHYYERVEGGLEILGYFDKNNRVNIEFAHHENKVVAVVIQKIEWGKDD